MKTHHCAVVEVVQGAKKYWRSNFVAGCPFRKHPKFDVKHLNVNTASEMIWTNRTTEKNHRQLVHLNFKWSRFSGLAQHCSALFNIDRFYFGIFCQIFELQDETIHSVQEWIVTAILFPSTSFTSLIHNGDTFLNMKKILKYEEEFLRKFEFNAKHEGICSL